MVGRELHQIRYDATEWADISVRGKLWLLRGEMEMRWGPANGRQGKKDEVRMKERKIKERKMPGSALVPNYGTARRDPLQRRERALVDRFGVGGDVDWRMSELARVAAAAGVSA